jgi:hypothetical protein
MDGVVAAHAHRQPRGFHGPVSLGARPWNRLAGVALIGACARSSPPPPPASESLQPVQSAPVAVPVAAPLMPAEPSASANTGPTPHQPDAPSPGASAAAKEEFVAFVASRQACASANDCAIVPGSCPFGCFVPVANAAAAAVTAKLAALGERLDKTGNRCVYRCMAPPVPRCVEHRCRAGSP